MFSSSTNKFYRSVINFTLSEYEKKLQFTLSAFSARQEYCVDQEVVCEAYPWSLQFDARPHDTLEIRTVGYTVYMQMEPETFLCSLALRISSKIKLKFKNKTKKIWHAFWLNKIFKFRGGNNEETTTEVRVYDVNHHLKQTSNT